MTKCNETSVPGSKSFCPLFPRSRFYIFAVALHLRASLLSRAWNRLLQAVPSKRSRKREEVIVGLFMKNGGRIFVTAVGKRSRNKLRIWPRNPRDEHFSAQKAVKVKRAKWNKFEPFANVNQNSISPGFSSNIYCNFTLGNSNPR